MKIEEAEKLVRELAEMVRTHGYAEAEPNEAEAMLVVLDELARLRAHIAARETTQRHSEEP